MPKTGKKKPYKPPEIKEKTMTRHFMVCAINKNKCPPGSMTKWASGGNRCF